MCDDKQADKLAKTFEREVRLEQKLREVREVINNASLSSVVREDLASIRHGHRVRILPSTGANTICCVEGGILFSIHR